jgi:protein-disulfide isomerase
MLPLCYIEESYKETPVSREGKILTAILVVIVGGMIGLFALANQGGTSDSSQFPAAPDKTALVRDDSHKLGNGPVQVVEFGDIQCPACGNVHPAVKQLQEDYKDKITFVWRNYPLTNIHKNAMAAANAAEAAGTQGKYWEMHNKLFETQNEWSALADPAEKFAEYANTLGLDGAKIAEAVHTQSFKSFIEKDIADGNTENVQATPTFFINGKLRQGINSYATLRDAVDSELKAK